MAGIFGIVLAVADHRGLGVIEALIRQIAADDELPQLAQGGVSGQRLAPDERPQHRPRLPAVTQLQPSIRRLHVFPLAEIDTQSGRQMLRTRDDVLPGLAGLIEIDALPFPTHPAHRVLGKSRLVPGDQFQCQAGGAGCCHGADVGEGGRETEGRRRWGRLRGRRHPGCRGLAELRLEFLRRLRRCTRHQQAGGEDDQDAPDGDAHGMRSL